VTRPEAATTRRRDTPAVIILGLVLVLLDLFLLHTAVLLWLGIALIVVGLVLVLLGSTGHAVGNRRHYY
jgi:membrane-bound ClpP family serine protease